MMIDWDRVHGLQQEIGADSFAEVVELFLDEVETILRRLPDLAGSALEADLHFLKGSAWNLGFLDFGALCHDGERRCALGRSAEVDIGLLTSRYVTARQAFLAGIAMDTTVSLATGTGCGGRRT
jgi:hypothetical protein